MRLGIAGMLVCALTAVCAPSAHAQAVAKSDNVEFVTKLPEAVGAASARFSADGKTMYVSTWKGLLTYDISDPASPVNLGFLPLPHFENEDVDAGPGVVIISNDPSEGVGIIYVIDVSDPSLPTIRSTIQNGDIFGVTADSYTGHIANCLQGCKYLWTTGTDQGVVIFDLTDLDDPKYVKAVEMPQGFGADGELKKSGGFTHDVFIDRSGIAWVTGQDGTFGYTTADPLNPQLVYRTDEKVFNSGNDGPNSPDTANDYPLDFLHHNSIRTAIQLADKPVATPVATASPQPTTAPGTTATPGATATATPAATAPPGTTPQPTTGTKPASGKKPRKPSRAKYRKAIRKCKTQKCRDKVGRAYERKMRAYRKKLRAYNGRLVHQSRTTLGGLGDVMAITEEDYTRPTCQGQGSFQTWQIKPGEHNSDGSIKLDLLDSWTTELNNLGADGRAPVTVLCSAHWFDEDQGLLAQGWYDQGVRFLDINNPRDIKQVGYWVTQGTFWGAYYAPTDPKREIVYGLDVTSGIDVLRIDRTKAAKRVAPVPKRWMSGVSFSGAKASPTFGFACPLLLTTKPV